MIDAKEASTLYSMGDVLAKTKRSAHRIRWVIESRGIAPAYRFGRYRLWDQAGYDRILREADVHLVNRRGGRGRLKGARAAGAALTKGATVQPICTPMPSTWRPPEVSHRNLGKGVYEVVYRFYTRQGTNLDGAETAADAPAGGRGE